MDKWQKRMEQVTANAVWRALQKQKRELQETFKRLGIPDDGMLKVIIATSGKPVVDGFIERVKTTIKRGYSDIEKNGPTPLEGLDFNIPTKKESAYLQSLKDLHLSQAKGSITNTTEERVKKLVTSGIKEGLSAEEIAKNIEKLDPQVFSKNRADLIAINQIGKAKQFGEHLAVKEYDNAGYLTLKYWSTVNDRRVTRTHTANQNDGWIGIDETFSGTRDLVPPASDNPRCRCACLYKIGELKGGKQPKEIEQMLEARKEKQKSLATLDFLQRYYEKDNDIVFLEKMEKRAKDIENLKIIAPNLTKEELLAIWEYSKNAYRPINKLFRNSDFENGYDGFAIQLQSALYALPNYKGTTYRGSGSAKLHKIFEDMEVGGIFSDKAFFSTSTSKEIAKEFQYGDENIFIEVRGKTGKNIEHISSKPREKEVLFPVGTTFVLIAKKLNYYIIQEI